MTTPSLASLLKQACEFKNDMSWDDEDALDEFDRACLRGEYLENARLQPLIEGISKFVEAIERCERRRKEPIDSDHHDKFMREARGVFQMQSEALDQLRALIAKERV